MNKKPSNHKNLRLYYYWINKKIEVGSEGYN
jgi:hypothetical protein